MLPHSVEQHLLGFRPSDFATLAGGPGLRRARRDGAERLYGQGQIASSPHLARGGRGRARAWPGGCWPPASRPGERIALLAESDAEFVINFFACEYAGLVPAPLPLPMPLRRQGRLSRAHPGHDRLGLRLGRLRPARALGMAEPGHRRPGPAQRRGDGRPARGLGRRCRRSSRTTWPTCSSLPARPASRSAWR